MDKSLLDPKNNALIPGSKYEVAAPIGRCLTFPEPDSDELDELLGEATGDGADLGDGLFLRRSLRRPGLFVENKNGSVGNLRSLSTSELQKIRAWLRCYPQGNDLIPGLGD